MMGTNDGKSGSWPFFFMVIGMLLIMASPQVEQPMSLIISGLLVVAVSVIFWRRGKGRGGR